MTGRFETLIYTDCAPGQGLGGTAGLQFQARSAGADEGAMSLISKHLLYEPPDAWMRQRRAVGEYPPSLAHVYSRRYIATAAGIYLGREANGGREGNQLTHSIVTRRPDSYGLVRPAQLFQAPFWVDEPASTTECAPLPEGWQPGPFDPARAQEMVRRHPDGDELLLALLSALHRCLEVGGKRVLFVASDCAEVLCWLATATFLMPQRVALQIGFKVFTTDPATAIQPVLAVHPDWGGVAASINNDRGYVVFDLVDRVWSAVEPTTTARRWVGLFRAEDPYDVMDAVEVAYAVDAKDADVGWPVALSAVLHRTPATESDAHAVVSWLGTGSDDLVGAYGARITDLLLRSAAEWSPGLIGEISEIARRRGVADQQPIRLALLAVMIEQAGEQMLLPGQAFNSPAAALSWSADQAVAVDMIHEALRSAEPARFQVLLSIATLFHLPVSLRDVASAARHFVTDWADHPSRPYEPDRWPCRDELLGLLRDELDRRILAGASAEDIGHAWAHLFLRYPLSVDRPVGAAVATATMLILKPTDRVGYVEKMVRRALAAADGGNLLSRTVGALWAVAAPQPAESRALLALIPKGTRLRPEALPHLADRLLADPELAPARLEAVHQLVDSGFLEPDPELGTLLSMDRAVMTLCEALGQYREPLPGPIAVLREMPTRLLTVRFKNVLDALLAVQFPPVVLAALEQRPGLVGQYLSRLMTAVRNPGRPEHIVAAFYLLNNESGSKLLSEPVRHDLRMGVETWLKRVPDERFVNAADALMRQVGEPYQSLWRTERVRERGPYGAIRRFIPRRKGKP